MVKSKYWSAKVTTESHALHIEQGVFELQDPKRIATSLKKSAENSIRKKAGPFRSAMSMLNFYINRSGRNLKSSQKETLEQAKNELRRLFNREIIVSKNKGGE